MIQPGVLALGEHFGISPSRMYDGERAQDVARLAMTSGDERQPFEADHRVAAPVGEPVIAGDHRARIVARGRARASSAARVRGRMRN